MPFAPALRDYWHPVALSSALEDKPLGVMLLGERLVLWRSREGASAARDQCIHRGAKMSLGWVEDGDVVCPYHGWKYRSDGSCSRIPSMPAGTPIPERARVTSFKVQERYGLVFVCLGVPRREIIEFPDFGDSAARVHHVGPTLFSTGAARSFENFMDDTHLPWVHTGTLGSRDKVEPTPPRRIVEENGEFSYETEADVVDNRLDPNDRGTSKHSIFYRIVPPFSLYHANSSKGFRYYSKVFFSSPVTESTSLRFMVAAAKVGLDQPAEKMIKFTLNTWEQDRPIIESQWPLETPTDFSEEFHLRDPDGPSILYRRMMRDIQGAKTPQ